MKSNAACRQRAFWGVGAGAGGAPIPALAGAPGEGAAYEFFSCARGPLAPKRCAECLFLVRSPGFSVSESQQVAIAYNLNTAAQHRAARRRARLDKAGTPAAAGLGLRRRGAEQSAGLSAYYHSVSAKRARLQYKIATEIAMRLFLLGPTMRWFPCADPASTPRRPVPRGGAS